MTDNQPGIAIIGAGLIVEHAHLPAYRAAGLGVRGLLDQDLDRAARLADAWGVRAYGSIDELCEDPAVSIIDCAVTPDAQERLVPLLAAAGKHMLCQKPLAGSLSGAEELVGLAERAGVILAVNQQMRWDPTIRAMKRALVDGSVGDPVLLNYRLNFMGEYPGRHWINDQTRLFATFGTIHYLDSARFLFGEPERVTARLLRDRDQWASGETFVNCWVEWPDGTVLVGFERYTCKTGDIECSIRLDGTSGAVRGTLGIYLDYPNPQPDRVEQQRYGDGLWTLVSDDSFWLPDAFAQPMLSLIEAMRDGGEPATSGRDNLGTLRVVEALYQSDRLGRTVALDEIATR